MNRYHKKVYYPDNAKKDLDNFCHSLNFKKWRFSSHCLDNIKYRNIDKKQLLNFISNIDLKENNIFEYYADKNKILKSCFRLSWIENTDIILVLSNEKRIITVYVNTSDDLHYTLNKSQYNKD